MNTIHIIGLGAGDLDQLPLGVYKKLKAAENLYVRTADHPVLTELGEEGVTFQSFDAVYEKHDSFSPVYEEIAETLIGLSQQAAVIYAVPGHQIGRAHV